MEWISYASDSFPGSEQEPRGEGTARFWTNETPATSEERLRIAYRAFSPVSFGFHIDAIDVGTRTAKIKAIESQIRAQVQLLVGITPTVILSQVFNSARVFRALLDGEALMINPRIFERFEFSDDAICGVGPLAHYIGVSMATPALRFTPEMVLCDWDQTDILARFEHLYRLSQRSGMFSVSRRHDGINLIPELASQFGFEVRYENDYFSIVNPSTAEITPEWIERSVQRIRLNKLPLWPFSGSWFAAAERASSRAILQAGAFLALSELDNEYPGVGFTVDSVNITDDGIIHLPVRNSSDVRALRKSLRKILQKPFFIREVPNEEVGLQLRLSHPGSLMITQSTKGRNGGDGLNGVVGRNEEGGPGGQTGIFVVSLEDFTAVKPIEKLKGALLQILGTCQGQKDIYTGKKFEDMDLVELVSVINEYSFGDRLCAEAKNVLGREYPEVSLEFSRKGELGEYFRAGVLEGTAPGLMLPTLKPWIPTIGKVVLDTTDSVDEKQISVLLESRDQLSPVITLVLPEDIEQKEVQNTFQAAWNSGEITSHWGRVYMENTGRISRFPVFLGRQALETRDNMDMSMELLETLQ